jgi:hypothetical protein
MAKAKVKAKRVGRRRRQNETWAQKLGRVTRTLLSENDEGREARKAVLNVVEGIRKGKDPAELIREAFNLDEGICFDDDEFDEMADRIRAGVRKRKKTKKE